MSPRRPQEDEEAAGPPEQAEEENPPASASPHEGPAGLDPVASPESEEDRLRQERDELREQLLRRRADFENFRRRVERDRHTSAQEALAALLREVVSTVDNLERALSASGGADELRQGVELTHRELLGLLESHDVVALDPLGEPFDPTVHQALLHESVPGFSEGTVAEVFRKGYSFGERLLRPALVKVASGEESPEDADAEGGEAH